MGLSVGEGVAFEAFEVVGKAATDTGGEVATGLPIHN